MRSFKSKFLSACAALAAPVLAAVIPNQELEVTRPDASFVQLGASPPYNGAFSPSLGNC